MGAFKSRKRTDETRQSGIALVAVLWIMVVLAALATSFSTSTRTQVNLARNLVEASKAEAIADAGLARAAAGLIMPLDEGGLRADGTVYAWQFAGGEARFSMADEGGKIDLNAASRTLLRDLLTVAEVDRRRAETLADAIVAYRRGEAGGNRQFEAGADAAAEFGEDSGKTPFALVEELQQLPDMTGDVYGRLAPALTIYSGQPDPDANAALPEVRAALAVSRGQRETQANESAVDTTLPLPPDGPLSILKEGNFAARSMARVFTIHCEGRSPGGGIFARDAVIALEYGGGRPYSIRLWRQGRRWLYARAGEEQQ